MPRINRILESSRKSQFRVASAVLALGGLGLGVTTVGASAQQSSHASKGIVISTAKNSSLGTYLVSGTTVYTLKPSKIACTAECRKAWVPVLLPKGVTKATAGKGVKASALGTVAAAGALQVTYAGKALYWFYKDTAPGQVRGNVTDKWGKWLTYVTAKAVGGGSSSVTTTTVAGSGGTGGVAF